jgi:phoH family protein
MGSTEQTIDIPAELEKNVCGFMDVNLHKIERTLQVTMIERDGSVKVMGEEGKVKKAISVFENLVALARRGETVSEQTVNYALSLAFSEGEEKILEIDRELICRTASGRPVKPKTLGQKEYVDSIRKRKITFGIGPAGTGKTYLAMAMAIRAFRDGDCERIILTRPAMEAGEKLGFLPGDLQSKIDPYLRPIYDALYQIMGPESYLHNAEKGLIEVAPLAYMRGRTLDNAYIILDEAQNTTPSQMKMFLTRIGFGSKAIITGDLTQKDLPADAISGLDTASRVLSGIEEIGFCRLTSRDVVRHPLVQQIVDAYEKYEEKESAEKKRRNAWRKDAKGRGKGSERGDKR